MLNGTVITDSRELPGGCWEPNPNPLEVLNHTSFPQPQMGDAVGQGRPLESHDQQGSTLYPDITDLRVAL